MGFFLDYLLSFFKAQSECDEYYRKSQEKWKNLRDRGRKEAEIVLDGPYVMCSYNKDHKTNLKSPTVKELSLELEQAIARGNSTQQVHLQLFSILSRQKDYAHALPHLVISEIYRACGADNQKLGKFLRGEDAYLKDFRKPGEVYLGGRYFSECINALGIRTKEQFKKYFLNLEFNEQIKLPFTKEQLCTTFLKAWDSLNMGKRDT